MIGGSLAILVAKEGCQRGCSIQNAGKYSIQNAGKYSIQNAGKYSIQNAGKYSIQNPGKIFTIFSRELSPCTTDYFAASWDCSV